VRAAAKFAEVGHECRVPTAEEIGRLKKATDFSPSATKTLLALEESTTRHSQAYDDPSRAAADRDGAGMGGGTQQYSEEKLQRAKEHGWIRKGDRWARQDPMQEGESSEKVRSTPRTQSLIQPSALLEGPTVLTELKNPPPTRVSRLDIEGWDIATLDKWIENNRPGGGVQYTPSTAAEWLKNTKGKARRDKTLYWFAVKTRTKKAVLCRFWWSGTCKYGKECRFEHPGQKDLVGGESLSRKSERSQNPPATPSPKKKRKKKSRTKGENGEEDYYPERTRGSNHTGQTAQRAASWW